MKSALRPNLFIIGAMKSGTTSLHTYLNTHSQIFMCEPKEPSYFVKELHWSKGEEWYLQLFAAAGEAAIIGESSTEYTKLPKYRSVTQRIARFNPQARFIYIMRDPIERTISHYWHMVRWYDERRDMLTTIREDSQYLDFSHYAMQLTPYYELFGRDRVYTLTFEEMTVNPNQTLQKIFTWLGVEASFTPPNFDQRMNITPEQVEQVKGWGVLHKFRYSQLWSAVGPHTPPVIRKLGRKLSTQKVDRASQPLGQVIDFVKPIQLEQTQTLSKMLNRQFPEWTTLYGSKQKF